MKLINQIRLSLPLNQQQSFNAFSKLYIHSKLKLKPKLKSTRNTSTATPRLARWSTGLSLFGLGSLSSAYYHFNEPGFKAQNESGFLLEDIGLVPNEVAYELLDKKGTDIHFKNSTNILSKIGDKIDYQDIRDQFIERLLKRFTSHDHLTIQHYHKEGATLRIPSILYNSKQQCSIEVHEPGLNGADEVGSVHQGLITHLLDEAFYRTAIQATAQGEPQLMFTVNLKVEFGGELKRLPKVGEPITFVLQYDQLNSKPHKAVLNAAILDKEQDVVGKAQCIYVIPKSKLKLIASMLFG